MVKPHIDDTSPLYYRVYNPILLVEFNRQPGIALDNDYGKDLLRQHYRQFDHSRADTPHRMGKA
jgi:hypothetical protein